jgi:aspartate kinase
MAERLPSPPLFGRAEATYFERDRGVTAVHVEHRIAHATLRLRSGESPSGKQGLLDALAQAGIPIFLVKLHPGSISLALRHEHLEQAHPLLREYDPEHALLVDLAQVTTLAGAMRDLSGVIADIYEALLNAGVRVCQTGDAHNAVLVLVAGDQAERAVQALAERFGVEGGTR